MSSRQLPGLLALCCLGFAEPAAAQLDSSALRAKFGPPLNRETFHMPSGFDMIVEYGTSNQVCKLELPALMPTSEKISNASAMRQRMYDFLAGLVPDALRGKELQRMAQVAGMISLSSVEYEHVTVSELEYANEPFSNNNTITVIFKNDTCPSFR
jgi:hypothetical protein